MKLQAITAIAAGAMFLASYAGSASAQGQCRGPAAGTVQACGTAPGYFRPQPYTLSPNYIPKRAEPGSYYAPIGRNQENWQQYNQSSGYGPVEPNPYGKNGQLSLPRTAKHVAVTRVGPAIERRRNNER